MLLVKNMKWMPICSEPEIVFTSSMGILTCLIAMPI